MTTLHSFIVSAVIAAGACSNAADPHTDAPVGPHIDAATDGATSDGPTDAPLALRIIVLNEVAAGETPDWIEVVNATTTAVPLGDFVYVDAAGDFTKAKPFPAMMLAPGVHYVQNIDDATSGFKLGSDEEVWIYRASDHALSDGVDWAEGDSPMGMSFARSPDVFGPFVTGAPSKGAPNP